MEQQFDLPETDTNEHESETNELLCCPCGYFCMECTGLSEADFR